MFEIRERTDKEYCNKCNKLRNAYDMANHGICFSCNYAAYEAKLQLWKQICGTLHELGMEEIFDDANFDCPVDLIEEIVDKTKAIYEAKWPS
jgi:hypothetical protein